MGKGTRGDVIQAGVREKEPASEARRAGRRGELQGAGRQSRPFPPADVGPAARRGSAAGSRRAADAALAIALSFPQ